MNEPINSVIIEGNFTADPKVKEVAQGNTVANFSIACNRTYSADDSKEKKEKIAFFNVEAWGSLAGFVASHISKGDSVRIIGKLKQNRWADDKNNTFSRVYIRAQSIILRKKAASETERN